MHNGFLDKRRRHLNLREMQVESVLPEHFAQFYPKFISLLKKYYEWQDQNNPNELLHHLFAARDINETDITLLSYIEDEFLLGEAYFEGFGDNDWEKRAAANFSNHLFRSKGTKFAIEWFFRSFYGLDAEVVYPKENVFTLNDTASQIGPDSLRYLTNDKLYQTFALLVRVGVPISKWRDIFKLFAHPAGMYLGAEVSVEDLITENITAAMLDSAVAQRNTSVFTITPSPSTVDEGSAVDLTVTATNIPDNIGSIYYYISHGTTSDSDFANQPTIANPGYVAINDSAGTAVGRFSITPKIDSAEGESSETFDIVLRDGQGRTRGSTTITINDVVSSYSLAPSSTLVGEGTNVTFTATGTNVPSSGSTTLYYYIEHITTDSTDFANVPDSESPIPFSIYNSTGTFTISPVIDPDLADSGEQFKVIIQTFDGIKKDSATITIANNAPIFSIASIGSVTEGNNLVATITADTVDIGDTLTWSITGAAASDDRLAATSGTTVLTSTSQNIVVAVSFNDSYIGSVSGTFSVTNAKYDPDITVSSAFTIVDATPVYNIEISPSIISEGDTATFEISGSNIQDGTYYFYIDNISTDDFDFLGGRPTNASREAVTITNNSGTTNSITFSDSSELRNELFAGLLYTASTGGTLLKSQQFTIAGSSYSLTPSTTSVDENDNVNFTLTGNDGLYYYWIEPASGTVEQADFASGWASSTSRIGFAVTGGTGSFSLTLSEDLTTEGTETFRVKVSNSASGGLLAESSLITISDTSTTPVPSIDTVVGPSSVNEGETATINVTTSNVPDGTVLNWSVSNSGDFDVSTGTVTITSNAGSFTVTPSADGVIESAETFSASVSGTVSGTPLSRTSPLITINDTSNIPAGTFIAQRPEEGNTFAAYIRDEETSDDGETVTATAKLTTRFSRASDGFKITVELDEANDTNLWYQPIDSPNTLTTSPVTIYTNTAVVPDEIKIVYSITTQPIGLVGPEIDLGWQATPSNGIEESIQMTATATAGAGADVFSGKDYTVKYYGRASGYSDALLATFKFRVQAYADAASF